MHLSTHDDALVYSGHATVSPAPQPKIIWMVSSSQITVDGLGFVDWFHQKVRPLDVKNPRKGYKPFFGGMIRDAALWSQIFDDLPTLTGKQQITFNEFLAYHFIIYKETGFHPLPVVEVVPTQYLTDVDPEGDNYFFNYNHTTSLGNELAGDQMVASGELDAVKDADWVKSWNKRDAGNYPFDAPEVQRTAARECDFYKYRGRGFCQLTGRANYALHAKRFLAAGSNMDTMSDADLTAAFADVTFCMKVFHSYFHKIGPIVAGVNDEPPNWTAVGLAVNGAKGTEYAAELAKQCTEVLAAFNAGRGACE